MGSTPPPPDEKKVPVRCSVGPTVIEGLKRLGSPYSLTANEALAVIASEVARCRGRFWHAIGRISERNAEIPEEQKRQLKVGLTEETVGALKTLGHPFSMDHCGVLAIIATEAAKSEARLWEVVERIATDPEAPSTAVVLAKKTSPARKPRQPRQLSAEEKAQRQAHVREMAAIG